MQPSSSADLNQDIKTLADWLYEEFRATDPIEVKNILDTPYFFKYCVGETIETPDQTTRKVVDRQYEEHTFQPGETMVLMGSAAYIFIDGLARSYVYKKVTAESKIPLADGGMGLDHAKAEEQGANATASVEQLVAAAKLAIVGRVGYATHATPQAPAAGITRVPMPTSEPTAPGNHNPNAIADNNGVIPGQVVGNETPTVGNATTAPELPTSLEDDDAFSDLGTGGDDGVLTPPATTEPPKPAINPALPTEFTIGEDSYDITANGRTRKNKQFVSVEAYAAAQAYNGSITATA